MRNERITRNPDILFGKPTVRNLRYSVSLIQDLLSAGMTPEDILEDYEDLELEDIHACSDYSQELTNED